MYRKPIETCDKHIEQHCLTNNIGNITKHIGSYRKCVETM